MNDLILLLSQEQAVNTVISHVKSGRKKNLLHIAPGTGRGTVILKLVEQLKIGWPDLSIQIICPTKSQESQLLNRLEKLKKTKGSIRTAVLGNLLGRHDKRSEEVLPLKHDIIILAEFTASDKLLSYLESFPEAIKIAFSLVPEHSDYFGKLIFKYAFKNAIADGLFVPFVLNNVKVEERPFYAAETGERIYTETYLRTAASAILDKIKFEKTIVYCPTISFAERFCKMVNELTATPRFARLISSSEDEKSIATSTYGFTDAENGPFLLCIVDMMHISLPMTRHIAIFRSTKSLGILQQMLIPGVTKYADKELLQVYDFVGLKEVFEELDADQEVEASVTEIEEEKYFKKSPIKFRDKKDIEGVLGVDVLSQELAEIIEIMPGESGSMIGIFGKWGRGKTFLMDHTWSILKKKKKFIRIDFHAWKYQDTPATWAYLYECLSERYFTSKAKFGWSRWISSNFKRIRLNYERNGLWPIFKLVSILLLGIFVLVLMTQLKQFEARLTGVFFSIFATFYGFSKAFTKDYSSKAKDLFLKYSNKQSFKEHLGLQAEIQKEMLNLLKTWIPEKQKNQKKILLFVDDIDRCNEQKIIELIDALRVLTEAPAIAERIILVAAIDERILKRAIKVKYSHLLAVDKKDEEHAIALKKVTDEYIDKLFITGLKLGRLSKTDSDEFLITLTKVDRETNFQLAKLVDLIQKEVDEQNSRMSQSLYDDTLLADYLDAQDAQVEYDNSLWDEPSDYQELYLERAGEKQQHTGTITASVGANKLNHEEVDILRLALNRHEDLTPRQIRIFYFRYLIAKNLLIRHYDKLGRTNIWQEKKRSSILARLITQYSWDEDQEALEKHKHEIQSKNGNYHQVPFYRDTYVDMEDYRELLKVLSTVIAY